VKEMILTILLIITFILILLLEYRLRSLALIMWGGLFVLFLIPHSLEMFLNANVFPLDVMNKASFFVISFNFVYFIIRLSLSKFASCRKVWKQVFYENMFDEKIKDKLTNFRENIYIKVLILNMFLALFILIWIIINNYDSIFATSWVSLFNIKTKMMTVFNYIFIFSSSAVFVSYIRKNKINFRISLLLALFITIIIRSRAMMAPLILPIIVLLVFNPKFKIRIKYIFLLGISVFVIIYSVYALQMIRYYGTLSNFFTTFSVNEFNHRVMERILQGQGELGLRYGFYYFIEHNNSFENFGTGKGYIRLLMLAIPSVLSGDLKPRDFAMDMYNAMFPDYANIGGTFHPTLYGECYANLGWLGILLAIFWAVFATLLDVIIKRNVNITRLSIIISSTYMYALIARGAVYNSVSNFFIDTILYIILWQCIKLFVHRKSNLLFKKI
jgi:hypothetical protein